MGTIKVSMMLNGRSRAAAFIATTKGANTIQVFQDYGGAKSALLSLDMRRMGDVLDDH
jgi:hypothetical protein